MAVGAELVVQRLAYAALDALRLAMPLDLCAYLHVVPSEGPQLYLRAPDLSAMTATQAFDVFTALRDAVDAVDAGDAYDAARDAAYETKVATTTAADAEHATPERCRVGGFESIAIRTAGADSKGVFVVGRRDGELAAGEVEVVDAMCTAMGDACHTVEASGPGAAAAAPSPVRPDLAGVGIRIDDGVAHANVSFSLGDGTVARGSGEAAATTDAVALATLDALGHDWKLGDVAEGLVGGERVMTALVRDRDDRVALGATLVSGDPVRAAAEATAAAVTR